MTEVHERFRLWITAEPHPAFPIGLLQMGIKLTNEAPVGIKAGLRASYQWINQVISFRYASFCAAVGLNAFAEIELSCNVVMYHH